MKRARFEIPWKEGLHLRIAAQLVKRAQSFRSSVKLKVNEQMADARSIFSILMLCASLGAMVDIEVAGDDEDDAFASVAAVFNVVDSELPEDLNDDSGDPFEA
ncbi:MAG: HPr family phosphocarrier protein [Verrucomicrobiae bacterium]|nr:HPr family phosphocarrier protein [Verrucomicrobiae bacterium]